MSLTAALLFLAAAIAAQALPKEEESAPPHIREEVTVRSKASAGPGAQVPPPRADKAVVDQVIRSLDVYKSRHEASPAQVRLPGAARLSRPFPEPPYLVFSPRAVAVPYESWVFEVLQGSELVWRTEGQGRLKERLEWDGSDSSGASAARLEKAYHFRFTGKSGGERFILTSEPVSLKSLVRREYLGDVHLEVANSALFTPGKASFKDGAMDYLTVLGERMRRANLEGRPYRFLLYSSGPSAPLAQSRAENLRRHFSKSLVINPGKIQVDILAAADRGETMACVLPPEKGASIRTAEP